MLRFVIGNKLQHKLDNLGIRRTAVKAAYTAKFRKNATIDTQAKMLLVRFVIVTVKSGSV